MADDPNNLPPEHKGIMEQSLADVLQNNSEAQKKVMQAMNITPEQLQNLLKTTNNNDLMHTKIKDLFSSGFITKSLASMGKVTPEQMQQIGNTQEGQVTQEQVIPQTAQMSEPTKQPSWLQKIFKFIK